MTEEIRLALTQAVRELIAETTSPSAIRKSFETHSNKVHFIPPKYRVLGGLLQSLNIKFGNFIEKLVDLVVENDRNVTRHPKSGNRIRLKSTEATEAMIDAYITSRQLPDSPDRCDEQFGNLLAAIVENEREEDKPKIEITRDVDSLFQCSDESYVYVEIKYNDDHDTGKFVDINRKIIKTFAGLINELEIDDTRQLRPILYI